LDKWSPGQTEQPAEDVVVSQKVVVHQAMSNKSGGGGYGQKQGTSHRFNHFDLLSRIFGFN